MQCVKDRLLLELNKFLPRLSAIALGLISCSHRFRVNLTGWSFVTRHGSCSLRLRVSPPRQAGLQLPRCKVPLLLYAPPIYCSLPISFVPCLLRQYHGLLHACCCVFPIPRLLNIYGVFHLFAWSVRPSNCLPDRLAPAGTLPALLF
jgi:hypothetical protein